MRFFAVFALVAVAEMATFFWVESQIGLTWALGLALATALVGSYLVKRAGISVLGRMQTKMGQGQVPGRELSDGAAILVSGAFLISPGFITDILGFLLLISPVRDVVYRIVSKRVSARLAVFTGGSTTPNQQWIGSSDQLGDTPPDVIDVESLD